MSKKHVDPNEEFARQIVFVKEMYECTKYWYHRTLALYDTMDIQERRGNINQGHIARNMKRIEELCSSITDSTFDFNDFDIPPKEEAFEDSDDQNDERTVAIGTQEH